MRLAICQPTRLYIATGQFAKFVGYFAMDLFGDVDGTVAALHVELW